jgi:hypothetical protein
MDELSGLEKEIYEYLLALSDNQFHEINSVQFSGTSADVEDALLSLEAKEIVELKGNNSFIDPKDIQEVVPMQARLIQE